MLCSPAAVMASLIAAGEVAEWSNAAVLKTVDQQWSVGSNPTLSAIIKGVYSGHMVYTILWTHIL
jgi:hypothetical protein